MLILFSDHPNFVITRVLFNDLFPTFAGECLADQPEMQLIRSRLARPVVGAGGEDVLVCEESPCSALDHVQLGSGGDSATAANDIPELVVGEAESDREEREDAASPQVPSKHPSDVPVSVPMISSKAMILLL